MRQQQHNAIVSNPLGLTGADELVNDALGRVVEVTKLSLPEDQGVGAGHGIAQLKAYTKDIKTEPATHCHQVPVAPVKPSLSSYILPAPPMSPSRPEEA